MIVFDILFFNYFWRKFVVVVVVNKVLFEYINVILWLDD